MRTAIFQVDAFAARRFAGNPAAVMPLQRFLADSTLQCIAAENNLAETAFLVAQDGDYCLRWFTPTVEVPLCGHATLASAAVVMERLEPGRTAVQFHSASGPLQVRRIADGYVMDFPLRRSEPVAAPPGLAEALGVRPLRSSAERVQLSGAAGKRTGSAHVAPDMAAIAGIDRDGVIVTSAGEGRLSTSSAVTSRQPREFPKIR